MGHIKIDLGDDIILDGELYAHGLSFQDNMKLIKKEREESFQVQYHVYDYPSDTGGFAIRYRKLREVIKGFDNINLVPTYVVHDEEELLKKHQEFISLGFEGTMIRLDNIAYEFNKRSSQLLKHERYKYKTSSFRKHALTIFIRR